MKWCTYSSSGLVTVRLFSVVVRDCIFFCFKQKTAYEMRISDWSSDVCSSDLAARSASAASSRVCSHALSPSQGRSCATAISAGASPSASIAADRKSVVSGKSASVRVDHGGRRIFIKKYQYQQK